MSFSAKGTFQVSLIPLSYENPGEVSQFNRMSIDKNISGDLIAITKGQMIASRSAVKGSAGYVAMEEVVGSLGGRSGAFVLQHSATMNRGLPTLAISVVPDSGSGELEGLEGEFKIDIVEGVHFYEFSYRFADKNN